MPPSAFSLAKPIPPPSMPQSASVAMPKPPPSMPSSSSVSDSKPPQSGDSNRSLSTTASTSSRTLKTPASKLEAQHVTIVDGADSLDGHAAYQYGDQTSPTPSRAMELPRKSGERLRLPFIPPPLAQGPLPQAPVATNDRKVSVSTNRPRTRPAPPILQTKKENRLSQDWVDLSLPTRPSPPREPVREKSMSPSPKPTASSLRLPPVSMIPMKGDSLSPTRPLFERTVSAPPLSPTGGDKSRSQRPARSSLDQLRNASSSPDPFRTRQNSMSMPPQAILDTGASSSSGGRLNIWRTAPAKPAAPELRTRRSEDLLRPGRPSLDALSKKELKAAQKEAQRNLGVASTAFIYTPPTQPEERKPSGLSLKKSSGALKALFKTKGKDKERSQTPPVPTRPARPSTAPSYEARPSFTLNRSLTPGSPASNRTLPLDMGRASTSADRSMSSGGRSSLSAERSMDGGRSSLSVERTFVREQTPTPAPTSRSASQGSHPVILLPAPAARVRIPARELPPLPPPSPVPPREMTPTPTSPPVQTQTVPPSTPPKYSPLEDAFPASSSLPYLGPRASLVMDSMAGIHGSAVGTPTTAASSSTSNSTARPESEDSSPYLKASRSLHLLQLPELDLDFGVTFDSLALGLSPSTPRKSPKSPARSNTTLRPRTSPSPKSISRAATITDRRRSRSFDGLDDFWRGERIFGQPSSTSAPMLSEPILPQSVPMEPESMHAGGSGHSHTQSVSSTSAPSSSDHARTPSNASSTNDTPSPSPPRTPPGAEHRSLRAFGFDFDSPSPLSTPTPAHAVPAVEDEIAESMTIGKTFVLNEPPTIPLPALPSESAPITLPDLPPATVLEPAAVIEADVPIPKPVQPETKQPQASSQRLMTRSRLVSPDLSFSNKALGREIERLLYTYVFAPSDLLVADRLNQVSALRNVGRPSRCHSKRPSSASRGH
ncbi:hypothetical protein BCR39DRAFT_74289 [Naematelia encephala]|uniref:Uncharacterized protein n=1 Tax=Naematelia encephala TaxID=71784 RepID=A0A1Y2AEF2_9TREE|nr:hypothetical protein BCR39DRAFT_74289 [Naematelia encephala]